MPKLELHGVLPPEIEAEIIWPLLQLIDLEYAVQFFILFDLYWTAQGSFHA